MRHVILAVIAALTSVALATQFASAGRRDLMTHLDAPAAMRLIRQQLAFGQRPAGSPQLRGLADRLVRELPAGRFESIPGQPGLRNIVGAVAGRPPALLIGAHYDTLAAPAGFLGANNGAAGTAIVIQIARQLARGPRPHGARAVRFVLFDGEEPAAGLPEQQPDFYAAGLRGSRAYVTAHPGGESAMLLLDYVAGRHLRLPREASSTPGLWALVRAAARHAGAARVFPPATGPQIVDDHTPFLHAGVPAVDLIDWTYPGHSLEDVYGALSQSSVAAVGDTILQLLSSWH